MNGLANTQVLNSPFSRSYSACDSGSSQAEHLLDHPDRVLKVGAHTRLDAVAGLLRLVDHCAVAVAAIGEILPVRRVFADRRALAAVGLVTPHARLIAMQKVRQHRRIVHVGRCCYHRVNDLAGIVHAEMRPHSEIPLPALPGLVHPGVARTGLVLG